MKSKPRVLVVDDEFSMLELLRNSLTLSGYEVFLADSAEDFREKAFASSPDIIILDIMLGHDDGTVVYHELLNSGLSRDIPVVFLSALAQDRPPQYPQPDRKFALIGKPFDPEKLVAELEKLLK